MRKVNKTLLEFARPSEVKFANGNTCRVTTDDKGNITSLSNYNQDSNSFNTPTSINSNPKFFRKKGLLGKGARYITNNTDFVQYLYFKTDGDNCGVISNLTARIAGNETFFLINPKFEYNYAVILPHTAISIYAGVDTKFGLTCDLADIPDGACLIKADYVYSVNYYFDQLIKHNRTTILYPPFIDPVDKKTIVKDKVLLYYRAINGRNYISYGSSLAMTAKLEGEDTLVIDLSNQYFLSLFDPFISKAMYEDSILDDIRPKDVATNVEQKVKLEEIDSNTKTIRVKVPTEMLAFVKENFPKA